MSRLARRFALVLAAGAVAVTAGCNSESTQAADGTTVLKVMMFPGQSYRLIPLVAQEEGIFKDNGITMEIVEQPANLQGIQGLYATQSDIGQFSVATVAQAQQSGQDARFFCGAIDVIMTTLMVPPDSSLPSTAEGASWQEVLQSLEGKTIGIQTPVGSGVQLIFAAALAEAGVEDVEYVNVGGGGTTVVAALKNGSVDVAQTSPPITQQLEGSGDAEPILYLPDGPTAYKEWYGSGWAAAPQWLEQEPELAEAFCRSTKEALTFVLDPANREAVSAVLQEDSGLDADTTNRVVDSVYSEFSTDLPKPILEETLTAYQELGVLSSSPEVTVDGLVDARSP